MKGKDAKHSDCLAHTRGGDREDSMYQQRSEKKENHARNDTHRGLRKDRSENDLLEPLFPLARGVRYESHSGFSQPEIEHARGLGYRPCERQKSEPGGSERTDRDRHEEQRRHRWNPQRGEVEGAVSRHPV